MPVTIVDMSLLPNLFKKIVAKSEKKVTNGKTDRKPADKKKIAVWCIAVIALYALSTTNNSQAENAGPKEKGDEIAYSDLLSYEKGSVKEAWVYSGKDMVILQVTDDKTVHAYYPARGDEKAYEQLDAIGAKVTVVAVKPPGALVSLLLNFLPIVLVIGVLLFVSKRGASGILSQIKQKNNPVNVPNTRFTDVAGVNEVVEDLQEVVDFLSNPDKYKSTGAKSPRGFLLTGMPGTGKTLLARAVAGEAGVPFYAITGSDFVEMFVGVGAARVRDLFKKAREEPKAIVFIDEIDAIGKSRSKGGILGSNDDAERRAAAGASASGGARERSAHAGRPGLCPVARGPRRPRAGDRRRGRRCRAATRRQGLAGLCRVADRRSEVTSVQVAAGGDRRGASGAPAVSRRLTQDAAVRIRRAACPSAAIWAFSASRPANFISGRMKSTSATRRVLP